MAITKIEYGSLASSSVMNDNFEYLEDKISDLSECLTTNTSTLASNISSLSGNVTSLNQERVNAIENLRDYVDEVKVSAEYDYFPDYSSGYQISLPFTAQEKGYVYAGVNGQDVAQYVYVNGKPVLGHCGYSGYKWVYTGTTFMVSEGDVVTSSNADGNHYFYPVKGNS